MTIRLHFTKNLVALLFAIGITNSGLAQNALDFDGVNDEVTTTYSGVLGTTNRTFEAWIYLSSAPSSNTCILDYGLNAVGSRNTFGVNGNRQLTFTSGGTNANISSSTNAVPVGQWAHVAFVLNNGTGYLYVNGTQVGTGSLTTVNTPSGGVNLIIGQRVTGGNIPFEGKIDEVRVWDVVRTPTQLSASSSSEFCGNEPGLKAYYKFNQGTAGGTNTGVTSAPDRSGNAYNGTLQNFALTGATSNWVTGATITVKGNTSNITLTPTACNSYLSPAGNTYDSSGTYVDTLMGSGGCDSIITINLTVNKLDLTVSRTTTTLTANKSGVAYQWLMCGPPYIKLSGKTSQSFMPTDTTKSYAVVLSSPGCTDTSDCYKLINDIGIGELKSGSLHIYPNPTNGKCHIDFSGPATNAIIGIYTSTGQLVEQLNGVTGNGLDLDVAHLPKGIYIIQMEEEGSIFHARLVLE